MATERDWIGEIQIAAWFDDGDIHARGARVGDDLLDFGDGKVATRFLRFRGLVIDDPVPFAGLDASEVLTGKLIAFGGTVLVDRIGPMNKETPNATNRSLRPRLTK